MHWMIVDWIEEGEIRENDDVDKFILVVMCNR